MSWLSMDVIFTFDSDATSPSVEPKNGNVSTFVDVLPIMKLILSYLIL